MFRYASNYLWTPAEAGTAKAVQQHSLASYQDAGRPSFAASSGPATSVRILVESICTEKDLYAVLGSTKRSSAEDLRRGFLARSRIVHPDKLPNYAPATQAFQRLSFAYEVLSDPVTKRTYDLTGKTDARVDRSADQTLNGVLSMVLSDFLAGDFGFLRTLINTLCEANPNLSVSEDTFLVLENSLAKLREVTLVGSKLVTAIKFELFSLYEVQQQIRQLSYFNLTGRLRLTVQLARITLQIPMAIDKALKEDKEDPNQGLLPTRVASVLSLACAVLEKGEEAGTVGVNYTCPSGATDMVFGGFKTPGIGREGGPRSLDMWLEEKSIIIKVKGF